eukprot:1943214-Rhodomonas_salina.1
MAVLLEVQALLVPLLCARLHRQRRVRLCAEVRQDLHQVLAVQEVEHRRPLRFVLFVDDHPHPGSSDGRVELLGPKRCKSAVPTEAQVSLPGSHAG